MTAKELKQKLDRMPDDAQIYITAGPFLFWKVTSVSRDDECIVFKSSLLSKYIQTYSTE